LKNAGIGGEQKRRGRLPRNLNKENLEVPGLEKFSLFGVDAGPNEASNFPVAVL
jgi:hypothetical protein